VRHLVRAGHTVCVAHSGEHDTQTFRMSNTSMGLASSY
jgi:hypothetical protein